MYFCASHAKNRQTRKPTEDILSSVGLSGSFFILA
uniref:Uncharacterized protein n=1 Tax=Siphoviridae sp. ctb8U30 TaxID=2823588 RepID=A0A8S5LDY1_9CAUD|nr:MAG TPA: hypothetical protein [Siphoviridae sp. ctb8U30]DAN68692.1 MAG TPA: hypothetical protein [Caudoviricetes sp.]DAQ06421.1 MAG TPA: hypothetical protein [Bacteriophage sp.]